ncbi:hypothetical protein HPP92_027369 [Vanilla planifolia]|uniref:Non-haem dioxygenase N-terminal domain-containing protein n=1 Tax=Vanilla planifolia TaxID=51239 RepID=A0A835PCL8_VANPL|nr:hypothetical protein HPP92_027369 [Vanilla planifolia]
MKMQRYRHLQSSGVVHLPSQYIQPPELRTDPHRQKSSADLVSGSIPVLDLQSSANSLPLLVASVADGSLSVVNHGVPSTLLKEMKEVGLASSVPHGIQATVRLRSGIRCIRGLRKQDAVKEEGVLTGGLFRSSYLT